MLEFTDYRVMPDQTPAMLDVIDFDNRMVCFITGSFFVTRKFETLESEGYSIDKLKDTLLKRKGITFEEAVFTRRIVPEGAQQQLIDAAKAVVKSVLEENHRADPSEPLRLYGLSRAYDKAGVNIQDLAVALRDETVTAFQNGIRDAMQQELDEELKQYDGVVALLRLSGKTKQLLG